MEENKDKKISNPGKLQLKKTFNAGQIKQSFSHGRSKSVSVEIKKKRSLSGIKQVETDGISSESDQIDETKVEVPLSTPQEINGNDIPSDEKNDINIEFNASNAFFSHDNIKMICRLIDERYPDYENVIPSDNSNSIEVDKLEILSSLKRISIYANKTTNQVRLKVSGSEILISAALLFKYIGLLVFPVII